MFDQIRNAFGERLDTTYHPGKRDNCLVVLGHGLTGNKDRPLLVNLAEVLSHAGWPCLRISFSGNGGSEGKFVDATITKETADLQAVLDAVPETTRVAYVGHSMGGAVGLSTAVRDERIRVLVSLAGMVFTRAFVEREFGDVTPGAGFIWDEPEHPLSQALVDDLTHIGDLLDAAAAVEVPWLLVHGTADDVVLAADSEAAFAAATVPAKRLLPVDGVGHAFDEKTYPLVATALAEWLDAHLVSTHNDFK